MAITFIGSATGVDSAPLPPHQAGDLILIFAYHDSATVAPTLPATYTQASGLVGGGNANAHRVGYRIAASSTETSGVWSGATQIAVAIYRGVDQAQPIGATANFTNVADVTYPALTLQTSDRSWVVGAHGRRTGSQDNVPAPTGTVLRADTSSTAAGRVAIIDTNKIVSSWPATASGGSNGFRYRSVSVELRGAEPPPVVEKRTGTLSVTLSPLTPSIAGRVKLKGALAVTLRPITVTSEGKLPVKGNATATLQPIGFDASGRLGVKGQLEVTLSPLTTEVSADLALGGVLAVTLEPLTLDATGRSPRKGSLEVTLLPIQVDASGIVEPGEAGGSVSATLLPVTLEAQGRLAVRAAAAIALDPVAVEAIGRVGITGALGVTLEPATLIAYGGSVKITQPHTDRMFEVDAQSRDVFVPEELRVFVVGD